MNGLLTKFRIALPVVFLFSLTSCMNPVVSIVSSFINTSNMKTDPESASRPRRQAPATGDGTAEDPYQIESLANLNWIAAYDTHTGHPDQITRFAAHYIQTADIDASVTANYYENVGFFPIGRAGWQNTPVRPFTGSYNGQGYTIDKLTITQTGFIRSGLFAFTDGASIKNVTLTNLNIVGDQYIGALIGFSKSTLVSNCFVSGTIRGNNDVGGLVGRIEDNSFVTACQSLVIVIGDHYVGGLAGHQFSSLVTLCNSRGSVIGSSFVSGLIGRSIESTISKSRTSAKVTGDNWVGGIAGFQFMSAVIDCYSVGRITGRDIFVGGLIGRSTNSTTLNSFSAGSVGGTAFDIGGLTGKDDFGEISRCYWDIETCGLDYSAGGEGRTTEDMTFPYAADIYVDWDFTEIWRADSDYLMNNGYPYLICNPPQQAVSWINGLVSHNPDSID